MPSELTPLISIITATFNSEKVLERYIQSVAAQTYPNLELIIIDGASEDGTLSIIKKYEGTIIKKWLTEKDSGVYDAWNKGLKLAAGEWISFIGSDDILYPDAYQSYVDYLNNNANRQLNYLSSKMEIINDQLKIVRELGWPWDWKISKRVCNIAHPGSLHHKDLFKKYGNFDTTYKITGDYDFLLRVGKNLTAGYMHKITLKMSLGGLSDKKDIIKEYYKAIYKSGNLSKIEMYKIFIAEYIKFYVKRVFRKFNIYLFIKK